MAGAPPTSPRGLAGPTGPAMNPMLRGSLELGEVRTLNMSLAGGVSVSADFSPENEVTVYPGDCRSLLRSIRDSGAKAQLVVTSPPYNIGKPYEVQLDIEEYIRQQEEIISDCVDILSDEGSICWQVGNHVRAGEIIPLDVLLYPVFRRKGLKLRNRIVWHFGHGLHATNRFSGRYETILWFTKSDTYYFDLDAVRVPQKYPGKKHYKGPKKGQYSGHPLGKNPSDVWEIPNVKANHVEKTIHPCQFPVALVERLILSLTKPKDLVVDPFLGVGTTAVASVINGRRCAGAEIVKEYCDIAVERIVKAKHGLLRIRPDVPVYTPPPGSKLTQNPWR